MKLGHTTTMLSYVVHSLLTTRSAAWPVGLVLTQFKPKLTTRVQFELSWVIPVRYPTFYESRIAF